MRANRFAALSLAMMVTHAAGDTRAERPRFAPAPASPIVVGDGPGSIASAEVNQDGAPDLVVGSKAGITVLLGQGDGRFRAAPGSPIAVPHLATELVARDFDADGNVDLAWANHDRYEVALLFGDGHGRFVSRAPEVKMREGAHPHTHGLDAGDLNGDGTPDLVTVNSEDNDVSVAFGDGKGGFRRAHSSFPVGLSPYPGAVADLNGDGHLDIIATSTSRRSRGLERTTKALTVLFGDGRGGFRRSLVPLRTPVPWFVAVADVNGDRTPDLVVTHAERSELTVLLGKGSGIFTEVPRSPFDLGHAAWRIAVADLNGDGRADVAAPCGDGLRVLLGDGRGGFRAFSRQPVARGRGAWQLAVADMNRDGKPDIAMTNVESDDVTVLLGQ